MNKMTLLRYAVTLLVILVVGALVPSCDTSPKYILQPVPSAPDTLYVPSPPDTVPCPHHRRHKPRHRCSLNVPDQG